MRNEELEIRNWRRAGCRPQIISAGTIILLFLLLSVNLSAQNVQAQEAPPTQEAEGPMRISLEEAVALALENNLSLESSRISLETRRRASAYSWNQFIPSITVAGAYSRDIPTSEPQVLPIPPPFGPINLGGGQEWVFAAPINVSLTISPAMFANMNRLRIDYENGLLSYEKARIQLERDVRKAYHAMLLLQENIELLRVSFANVERQVQMAQANYNAGLAPELTVLQARVARENMRPIIDQTESGLRLSMAQFAMFLGLDVNTQFEFIPITETVEFISLDINEMVSRASANKPEVQELIQTIRMLNSARMTQILSLGPALTVSWGTTPTYIGDPAGEWRDFSSSLTISVALRLHSLIPFSTDFQGIRNLDDQIRTAEIGLTQLISGTEIEVYNLVLSLERMRLSAEAQRQTVNLAQQAYRLTEQAYQAGLQDYFQVQNALQSLHQARVQMLEQQFNYLNGLIDLEYAIGVPFGTLSN